MKISSIFVAFLENTNFTSFSEKGNLNAHIKIVHEGIKSKCSICDAIFSKKHNLKKHFARVHEGKKPIKSSIYDVSFTISGN